MLYTFATGLFAVNATPAATDFGGAIGERPMTGDLSFRTTYRSTTPVL
jgi:hypothetical protein